MPLAEGEVIAGYTVVRSLGAGGMGEVYLVQHPRLPRRDALKVLGEAVCSDGEYRERFHREADIAGGLSHPHIVMVHDRGDVDGRLWISMDYVEGTDAGRLLEESYPNGMPPDLVIRLVTAVADALDYAHGRGLTHRDVKPANVLIANPGADDERIMLADFGIARRGDDTSNLTGTNMTVGTVSYAAPEQLTGDAVDGRADQYALAASAYQLLTGAPPFQHSNPAVVISAHLTSVPPPIGTRRPELDSMGPAFDRAMAKTPDERFTRCLDFARALAHNLDTVGSAAGSDAHATVAAMAAATQESGPRHARPVPQARTRRSRWVIAGVVAAILALVVAVALLSVDDERERRAADAPKPSISVPVVVVGADCATLGAAGVTETGEPAFCAGMPSANRDLWSLREGDIPAPTIAAAAGDQVYAPATETPVLVCMEQTGENRLACHDEILAENTDPAANDTSAPTPTP